MCVCCLVIASDVMMNSAEISAFHSNKNKKQAAIDTKFRARIQQELNQFFQTRGLFFRPFIFIDDGSFEAETFLICCRNKGCFFQVLFDNVYICPNHLCVHVCKPFSHTCIIEQGKRGSVCCVFSGRDLSTHSALGNFYITTFVNPKDLLDVMNLLVVMNQCLFSFCPCKVMNGSMPIGEVECFDDRHGGNRHTDLKVQKSNTAHVTKSEMLYSKLTTTIKDVAERLCQPNLRRRHNKMYDKQGSNNHWKAIKLFRANITMERKLQADLKQLCQVILRNTDGKQQTLLLLKNMQSFIYYITTKLVQGINSKGVSILKPPKYATKLSPMPHHQTLRDIFGFELTKYAECMKCIQYIMEKPSFLTQLQKAMNHCIRSKTTTAS